MADIHFRMTADDSDVVKKINNTKNAARGMADSLSRETDIIGASLKKIGGSIAALGAGFSAAGLVKDIVSVRGAFQQLEIAFSTMLQSEEKGAALMEQLVDTAAKTPFDLHGIAQGAKQLLAYGSAAENVNDELKMLGNIAAGLSIPLNDLVYLFGTTRTQGRMYTMDLRQFMGRGIPVAEELAKQFGVTKDKVGELVTDGKVGFEELEKALRSMTAEGGKFYNLMERQSGSLTGQTANLSDAIDMLKNSLGKQIESISAAVISMVSTGVEKMGEWAEGADDLADNLKKAGEAIIVVASSWGTYKAAVAIAAAVQKAQNIVLGEAQVQMALAAMSGQTLGNVEAKAAAKTVLLSGAMAKLRAALLSVQAASPYLAIAAGVGLLVTALIKQSEAGTLAERKMAGYNQKMAEAAELDKEHAQAIDQLIDKLSDVTQSEENRVKYIEQLKAEYGDLIDSYIDENYQLTNLAELKERIAAVDRERTVEAMKAQKKLLENENIESRQQISKMEQSSMGRGLKAAGIANQQKNISANEEVMRQIDSDISKMISDAWKEEGLKHDGKWLEQAISDLKQQLQTYTRNDEWDDVAYADWESVLNTWEDILAKRNNPQKAAKQTVQNKEYWQSQKKELQEELDAMTAIEAESERGLALKEKIKFVNEQLAKYDAKQKDNTVNHIEPNTFFEDAEQLLKEYKAYNQTRLDIETEYNDKLRMAQQARILAEETGDAETISEWSKTIAKIEAEMGKALINFDFEELRKDPEYVKAFENLDYTSTETLERLKAKLEEMKIVAAESLDPSDIQAYTSAIENIDNEISSRNPFKTLKDAHDELQEAMKSGNTNDISKAQEKYNKALKNSITLTDDLLSAISNLSEQIGGEAGEIVTLIVDVGSFLTTAISGIHDLGMTGAQALTTVEKASVILNIASTALSVFNKLKSAVSSHREETERAEQAINSYRNAVRLAALDIQGDYDTIFGTDKFGRYQEAMQKAQESLEAFKEGLKDTSGLNVYDQQEVLYKFYQGDRSYDFMSKYGRLINNSVFEDYQGIIEGLEEIKGLFMIDFGEYSSLLEFDIEQFKEGAATIFNWIEDEYGNLSVNSDDALNMSNLQTFLDEYSDSLSESEREYIQSLLDMWEAYEANMEEVKSYVSDIFGDIAADMTDTFFDSIEDSADAWQDWEQTGKEAVKNVAKQWLQSQLINKVLNNYSDAISDAVANNDVTGLTELMNKVVSEGGAFLESYKETFEWLSSGEYQQEASTGAFQSMSQATGDELNGRFTALQIAGENISQSMIAGIAELKAIVSMGANMSSNIYNILTQQVKANTFLEDIQKYTRQCAAFQSDITRIANKIQTL